MRSSCAYPVRVTDVLIVLAYSEVHRARSKKTGALVALKKIIMHNEKDGVSGSAGRAAGHLNTI